MQQEQSDWLASLAFLELSGIDALCADPTTLEQIAQLEHAKTAWRTPLIKQPRPAALTQTPEPAKPRFEKKTPPPPAAEAPAIEPAPKLELPDEADKALQFIAEHCSSCTRCPLHQTRTNVVPGVGNPHAKVVFVGEAPGADEDRQGEPFVGAAGQLLDRMLASIGFKREEIYIANVLKCRPPGNRNPLPNEVALCQGYLYQQLETIQPVAIFAMGRFAIQSLLGHTGSIVSIRNRPARWRETPVVASYHPAYYLRTPSRKKDGWFDLLKLKALLDQANSAP
uniref:Type-4 uracil-DNA glycosylase n=1 Tax=Magnetococcus massalia (strain MO-1) TaxID=451514 RepID=A0A1S7LM35_MAGMO|nr:protein of unknown function. Putative phage SPO1 DNA polymerase-related protein [Candidatus Magnetococcus massalia]